jgi:hypothetical protein
MQGHVSKGVDPDDSLSARFTRGYRIQEILFKGVLHSMMENKAQCRVTFSDELLQVLGHAKETNFEL